MKPCSGVPRCECHTPHGFVRRVVLTGGPGAGKTAVLELVQKSFCEHVIVLPEAAGIVFAGGFPRGTEEAARRSVQRTIVHVQRELERYAEEVFHPAVILCDRGTIDGVAYWPNGVDSLLETLQTDRETELARYDAVIHLRTPPPERGYNHDNPIRLETPQEAAALDARIVNAWSGHPRRTIIDSSPDFLQKAARALAAIHAVIPECCHAPIHEAERRAREA